MAYTWVKVDHSMLSDIRMVRFSGQECWAYTALLLIAGVNKIRGVVAADDEDLSIQCRFNTTQDWLYFKDKLIAKGMIEPVGVGAFRITDWKANQHRSPSDEPEATKARKQKERADKKAEPEGRNPHSIVEFHECHEVSRACHDPVTSCHENVTGQTRGDQKRLEETTQQDRELAIGCEEISVLESEVSQGKQFNPETSTNSRQQTLERPEGFIPTPDNLNGWVTTYRLKRVPHNHALFHYSLEGLADGMDGRGFPIWSTTTIEGVRSLAKKGMLGSDRKDLTAGMADHQIRGYLSARLSQLRSESGYEKAVGDLEAAHGEGVMLASIQNSRQQEQVKAAAKNQEQESAPATPERVEQLRQRLTEMMAVNPEGGLAGVEDRPDGINATLPIRDRRATMTSFVERMRGAA